MLSAKPLVVVGIAMALLHTGCALSPVGSGGSTLGGSSIGGLGQTSTGGSLTPTGLVPTGTGQLPGSPTTTSGASTQTTTSGTAQPPPADGRSAFEQSVDQAMFELLNQERAKVGAGPLEFDARLHRAAFAHAYDMYKRNYIDHTTQGTAGRPAEEFGYVTFPNEVPNQGVWAYHRAAKQGYPAVDVTDVNENVADLFDRSDPVALARVAMDQYRQSSGHWSNLLNAKWQLVGLSTIRRIEGAATDGYGQPRVPNCQVFAIRR